MCKFYAGDRIEDTLDVELRTLEWLRNDETQVEGVHRDLLKFEISRGHGARCLFCFCQIPMSQGQSTPVMMLSLEGN